MVRVVILELEAAILRLRTVRSCDLQRCLHCTVQNDAATFKEVTTELSPNQELGDPYLCEKGKVFSAQGR